MNRAVDSAFKRYRVVHVVASNVMFGALLLHIVVALAYAVGN